MTKRIIVAVALLLSAAPAAFAQSAYTTGTEASRVRAGYPSPYGYDGGLYNYVPDSSGQVHRHITTENRG